MNRDGYILCILCIVPEIEKGLIQLYNISSGELYTNPVSDSGSNLMMFHISKENKIKSVVEKNGLPHPSWQQFTIQLVAKAGIYSYSNLAAALQKQPLITVQHQRLSNCRTEIKIDNAVELWWTRMATSWKTREENLLLEELSVNVWFASFLPKRTARLWRPNSRRNALGNQPS